MKARDFPSYRLRHALRVWRARRYRGRNPLYYPPDDSSRPVARRSSEEDILWLPPSESLQRDDADG